MKSHRPASSRHHQLERRDEPIADLSTYRRRLFANARVAGAVVVFSLALGVGGYHWIVGVPDWLDCLLCASMILGGMGPVGAPPATAAGKVFASFYALYCGVVLLVSVGLLLTPALHRLLHRFHLQTEEDEDRDDQAGGKKH